MTFSEVVDWDGGKLQMVASDRADRVAPFRDTQSPVVSRPEASPTAGDVRPSDVSSICALVAVMLVELAWIGLLLFLARVFIFT